jgi:hypothetical protein
MTYEETDLANVEAADKIYSLFQNRVLPWADKREIPVVIVLHPFLSEITQPYKTYVYLDEKLSMLKVQKYYNARLDMEKLMTDPKDFFWPKDGHYNPKGYAVLAQQVYENVFKTDSLKLLKN